MRLNADAYWRAARPAAETARDVDNEPLSPRNYAQKWAGARLVSTGNQLVSACTTGERFPFGIYLLSSAQSRGLQ